MLDKIKLPVRYDGERGYIFDRENKIVVDASLFRKLPNPITEEIAKVLNEYPALISRVEQLEKENKILAEGCPTCDPFWAERAEAKAMELENQQ